MIYDSCVRKISDGRWHCPFSPEWVERMKHAAKHCKKLSAEYIEMQLRSEVFFIELGPGNFLSEPQDSRGLPISPPDKRRELMYSRCEIYDYSSIPDVVVTNGLDDWPLVYHPSVLMA
ncbi:MAG: hypothetical protein K6E67_11335 [Prevotella sp.]|nr:hypothetical protein [Prevotella sp.]